MSETEKKLQQSYDVSCGSPTQQDNSDSEDEDACSLQQLNNLFKHKYIIHDEPAVTNDSSYVLSLARDNSFTCIAAGLSNGSVRLFDINSENGVYIKPPITDNNSLSICGVRFVDETPYLLLVGTTNGLVRLLDLRTKNEVSRFVNIPTNGIPKDILSFDRNCNSRLLAMGTAEKNENVHILFYDLRSSNQLFSYVESHNDDLTCLRFHPGNPHLLCSGSTDGLINIFDVRENEDDAILTTVNTGNTVHKLNWYKNKKGRYNISYISHTNSLRTYTLDGDIINDFDRLKITESFKFKHESNCNLIDCFNTDDNNLVILAGSNKGSALRSCKVENGQLLPYANYEGSKQLVRESIFDSKTNILITAGESGFVTIWTPSAWSSATHSGSITTSTTSLKMKTEKSCRVTPY